MMDGKQGTGKAKRAKLDNVGSIPGKENKEALKVYPKRNRKSTSKLGVATDEVITENILMETIVLDEVENNTTTVHSKLKTTEPTAEPEDTTPQTKSEAKSTTEKSKAASSGSKSATTKPKTASSASKSATTKLKSATTGSKSATTTPKAASSGSKSAKSKAATSGSKSASAKSKTTPDSEGKRKRCMPKTVDKLLEKMDIRAASVSCCLKSAMCKGFIKITGDPSDLEQVVCEGSYDDHTYKVLVKDVLYQPDYAGLDYEDGCQNATALCSCCSHDDDDYEETGKAYVTRMCQGRADLDSGKFHNHCTECKGFGVCINDYRMSHCEKCNKHWFQGNSGFPCDNCKRIRQQGRGFPGLFMGMDDENSEDEYGDGLDDGCVLM